jgi:hypothetical protein
MRLLEKGDACIVRAHAVSLQIAQLTRAVMDHLVSSELVEANGAQHIRSRCSTAVRRSQHLH